MKTYYHIRCTKCSSAHMNIDTEIYLFIRFSLFFCSSLCPSIINNNNSHRIKDAHRSTGKKIEIQQTVWRIYAAAAATAAIWTRAMKSSTQPLNIKKDFHIFPSSSFGLIGAKCWRRIISRKKWLEGGNKMKLILICIRKVCRVKCGEGENGFRKQRRRMKIISEAQKPKAFMWWWVAR